MCWEGFDSRALAARSLLSLATCVRKLTKVGALLRLNAETLERAPTPLFGEKVRCSAHGRTFARVRYMSLNRDSERLYDTRLHHSFAANRKASSEVFFQRCRRLLLKAAGFVCTKVPKNGAASLMDLPSLHLGLPEMHV